MATDNETVSEIAKRVRRAWNSYPLPTAAAELLKLVRELEAAHEREVAELRECLKEAVGDKTGEYTMTGTEVVRWREALERSENGSN